MDRQRLFLTVVAAEAGEWNVLDTEQKQTVHQLLNESVTQQSWIISQCKPTFEQHSPLSTSPVQNVTFKQRTDEYRFKSTEKDSDLDASCHTSAVRQQMH